MATITIEEVESLTEMHGHQLEALDALYPDLFDKTVAEVSAQFQEGNSATAKKHIAALVAERLYAKLGTRSPDTQFHIGVAAGEARKFLTTATATTLPSIRPPRPTEAPKEPHG